ncbi:hypothetical protein [Burkholderia sp. L27(2015)]|uniref:hypothetical protein n=1 Tax=Burkholderia sp. L27(2015) TaxID=1641858 RepID=UPI00131CC501|nr:hypothetical protein [Burkholderia sp. L27(2015)]
MRIALEWLFSLISKSWSLQASLPEAAQSTDSLPTADVASQQCSAAEEVQAHNTEVVPDRIAELQRLVEQLRDDIDAVRLEKQEPTRQWDVVFALVTGCDVPPGSG